MTTLLNETDFLLWCKRLALTEKAQAAVTEARSCNPYAPGGWRPQ